MMHAVAFVTPSTSAAFGSRVPKRKSRRQSSRIVARAAECKRDAAVVSPVLSRSRRGVLFTGLAAVWAWTTPRAEAAAPPPTPDASNSAYIQSLLAKTEANKDRCVVGTFVASILFFPSSPYSTSASGHSLHENHSPAPPAFTPHLLSSSLHHSILPLSPGVVRPRRRALEQQNKYCLRQSQMGVGDCAGLPEEDLKMAMDESLVRFERKKAAAEAAAAEVDANIQ